MNAPPNFDRVARAYRWCEYLALGPLLQRTRCFWLPQVAHAQCALVLGDGDGRFTEQLLTHAPQLEATAVDTSGRMLQLLRTRCGRYGARMHTKQQSALSVSACPATDLIVTHFFLDCLSQAEVETLAQRFFAQTQPGTLWLLSDFAVPQRMFLHTLARLYIRSLYFAFRVLTGLRVRALPDPQTALDRAGFERIERHEKLSGVLYTEIWRHK